MFASISLPIGLFPPRNFEYLVAPELKEKIKPGSVVWVNFRRKKRWGIVEHVTNEPVFEGRHEEILSIQEMPELIQSNAQHMLRWLSETCFCSLAQAGQTALPLKLLFNLKGVTSAALYNALGDQEPQLTPDQRKAADMIMENFRSGAAPMYLLGPTGSGKTFVLLEVIIQLLKENRSVIYMVPEITLTPQFIETFTQWLPKGTSFGVWSSKTSFKVKKEMLARMLEGNLGFVLGTRSAVFLPMPRLGLMVLDEEQDTSFKQENPPPSYHARDVALFRARRETALAIFASATPSLECWQAIQDKTMLPVKLAERYGSRPLPKITLLKEDSRKTTEKILLEIVKAKIEEGSQVLIFHNRRGYARTLKCKNCAKSLFCSRCDIPLVFHKNGKDSLRCHHCGIHKNVPSACPDCGKPTLEFQMGGLGTQKIAETIRNSLGVKVLRLDKETSRDAEAIFNEYKKGGVPVLVGTKLVTKGWHYPNVNFVGVLNADQELVLPDFRSAERAFQNLIQVAGRAGRGQKAGEALMITSNPKHYVFESLSQNQWGLFYEKELTLRRDLNLPPFVKLLLIEIQSKNRQKVFDVGERMARDFKNQGQTLFEVAGATQSYFAKIRNIWRYHLVLKYTANPKEVKEAVFETLSKISRERLLNKVKVLLRPDPYNLF